MNQALSKIPTPSPVRIGLSGAHRVGKTYLASLLSEGMEMPFVRTTASATFKKLGIDPAAVPDWSTRIRVQRAVMDSLADQWAAGGEGFCTDRTPLDMAAYTLHDAHRFYDADADDFAAGGGMDAALDYAHRCIEMANAQFDAIILIQPGIELVHEDGKAALDEKLIESLNSSLLDLLKHPSLRVPAFVIPREVVMIDERIESVANIIDSL